MSSQSYIAQETRFEKIEVSTSRKEGVNPPEPDYKVMAEPLILKSVLTAPEYNIFTNITTTAEGGSVSFDDLTRQNYQYSRSSLSVSKDFKDQTDTSSLGFRTDDPWVVKMQLTNKSIGELYWHSVKAELSFNSEGASNYGAISMPDDLIDKTPNNSGGAGATVKDRSAYSDNAQPAWLKEELLMDGEIPELHIKLPEFVKGELPGGSPSDGYYQLTFKYKVANAPENGADSEFATTSEFTWSIEFQIGEALYVPPECKLTDWHRPDCIPFILKQLFGF